MLIRIGLFVVCGGQRELMEQLSDVAGSRTVCGGLPCCKIWSSYSNVAEDLNHQSCYSVIWHYIICLLTLDKLPTEAATPHVLAMNWIWSGSVMQQNSGLYFWLCTGWNVWVEVCALGCVLSEMCVLKVEVHADFSVPFEYVLVGAGSLSCDVRGCSVILNSHPFCALRACYSENFTFYLKI